MMKEPVEEPLIKAASSAEEELVRVRTAFVWRVSTEILKQLLEALVTDGVLNELEKDSILEGNPVRADKARCFIDTVRKKGDKASRIMIRHLQIKDQSLFSQLHLYSDPSAQQEALQNCQPRLKFALRKKFQCVFEGIAKAGNPTLLNQIYTELYITEGAVGSVSRFRRYLIVLSSLSVTPWFCSRPLGFLSSAFLVSGFCVWSVVLFL
ncbi:uncharacterized protein LOC112846027 [Oreochromis niloticus]|uniref:uncharacterized protein LOC112846027 n=1 Tax=Oreochromis niloticus TaxID=8128 RepID=UPI000DF12C29|nr:uncharacterized protein LOC112846027 [Oreochromis niloticus]